MRARTWTNVHNRHLNHLPIRADDLDLDIAVARGLSELGISLVRAVRLEPNHISTEGPLHVGYADTCSNQTLVSGVMAHRTLTIVLLINRAVVIEAKSGGRTKLEIAPIRLASITGNGVRLRRSLNLSLASQMHRDRSRLAFSWWRSRARVSVRQIGFLSGFGERHPSARTNWLLCFAGRLSLRRWYRRFARLRLRLRTFGPINLVLNSLWYRLVRRLHSGQPLLSYPLVLLCRSLVRRSLDFVLLDLLGDPAPRLSALHRLLHVHVDRWRCCRSLCLRLFGFRHRHRVSGRRLRSGLSLSLFGRDSLSRRCLRLILVLQVSQVGLGIGIECALRGEHVRIGRDVLRSNLTPRRTIEPGNLVIDPGPFSRARIRAHRLILLGDLLPVHRIDGRRAAALLHRLARLKTWRKILSVSRILQGFELVSQDVDVVVLAARGVVLSDVRSDQFLGRRVSARFRVARVNVGNLLVVIGGLWINVFDLITPRAKVIERLLLVIHRPLGSLRGVAQDLVIKIAPLNLLSFERQIEIGLPGDVLGFSVVILAAR